MNTKISNTIDEIGVSQSEHRNTRLGVILALMSSLCFALSGTAAKFLMEQYECDALWLAQMRQLGSCALLFIVSAISARQQLIASVRDRKSLILMAAYGLFGVMVSQLGYLEAIDYTNSATATVLENSSLVFLLVYTCLSHGRFPTGAETISVLLAIAGVYLLATGGDPSTIIVPLQGVWWGLAAGAATAVLSVLPSRGLENVPSMVTNAVAMLVGGVVLAIVQNPLQNLPQFDLTGVFWACFVVFVGTFGAYALYVKAAKEAGPMRTALLITVEPIIALITSVLWLGQAVRLTDLVGMGLIIAMVVLTTVRK